MRALRSSAAVPPCFVSLLVALTLPALAKKESKGPLCHADFRSLERCLSSDYERLRTECSGAYGKLKSCLKRDWKHIDDEHGYTREDESFNRMRRCKHGVMLYNPLDWYIGRALEVYGEWGEKKVQLWEKVVKAGHVVVDVGAHVGALTLPLSRLVGPTGRVVAFEPFYPSYGSLAANVGLNSLQNVELRQMVVADRAGKIFMNRNSLAFGMHDFFNFGSMNYNSLRIYNSSDDVERPSTEWDEYQVAPLDLLSLSRLDFLKIDAEAMEIMVLEGAARIIKRFKPVIFVEYRNPWEKDTNVLDFLRKKMRYECVLLRVPIFNTDNFRGHAEDIWSGAGSAKIVSFNLLCKHRWWEYPDMNEELLDLFDTAVDTDIEGLRTTATADPFEAMAQSQAASNLGRGRMDGQDSGRQQGAKNGGSAPPAASGNAGAGRPARRAEELTLDELLDGGGADGSSALGERSEEMSLDELLGTSPPSPPPRKAAAAQKPPPAAKRYEEMSLDELLDESFPEGAGQDAGGAQRNSQKPPVSEDQLLADLLGESEPVRPAAKPQRAAAGGAGAKAAKKAAQRPVEDLTLDELLGGGGDDAQELTLDELLGTSDESKGAKRVEDMTIDELLGPEPSPAPGKVGEKPLIDELLGESTNDPRYEEMSLDELLALDDPPPAPPPPPPQKESKKNKKAAPAPPSNAKAKPHVEVSYDDELSLDEL